MISVRRRQLSTFGEQTPGCHIYKPRVSPKTLTVKHEYPVEMGGGEGRSCPRGRMIGNAK